MALQDQTTATELLDNWSLLDPEERLAGLLALDPSTAETIFFSLDATDQAEVLLGVPERTQRTWMRLLPRDDAADVIQEAPPEARDHLLTLLEEPARSDVTALLAYAEDQAGGLMSPHYARVRPDMTPDEAISYIRRQARERLEILKYVYVIDANQRLVGVASFGDIFSASSDKRIRDLMATDLVTIPEGMDQEDVARVFAQYNFIGIPVVDAEGHMKGLVTVDDIVDVVEEEATEDIQKYGGMEALDDPYLDVGLFAMVRKRGLWLMVLFLGEMLTASAMASYEDEVKHAVVLALFIPLIISSGGNSGSQASTLVIRAMALGEVRLWHWWAVARREVAAGAVLGFILGAIGLLRILAWDWMFDAYPGQAWPLGLTVASSLLGVVMFGTIAGSMLPFVLRRMGFDPASASAPFVATLVDVTGLIIYFSVASLLFGGHLV